jgi:hypothetical protein
MEVVEFKIISVLYAGIFHVMFGSGLAHVEHSRVILELLSICIVVSLAIL